MALKKSRQSKRLRVPLCDERGQDVAQAFGQLGRPEVLLELEAEARPRRSRSEVLMLCCTRLRPGDSGGKRLGVGLLHAEPAVREWLLVVRDKLQPVPFIAGWDAVWLRQDAWMAVDEWEIGCEACGVSTYRWSVCLRGRAAW